MADPPFTMSADDDLPRTLRRERDRQQQSAVRPEPVATDEPAMGEGDPLGPPEVTVTRLRIPFLHMMFFCIKLVLAAIPALILLGALLWLSGEILMAYFPQLVKMQILIRFPG